MTVADLIEVLKTKQQDAQVLLQRDDEGNGFRFAHGADDNCRHNDGEVKADHLTPEMEARGFTSEDVMQDGERVVVIF